MSACACHAMVANRAQGELDESYLSQIDPLSQGTNCGRYGSDSHLVGIRNIRCCMTPEAGLRALRPRYVGASALSILIGIDPSSAESMAISVDSCKSPTYKQLIVREASAGAALALVDFLRRLAILALRISFALIPAPACIAGELPALIREALTHHPSLRAQSSIHEATKAGVEGAKWQYWPTPSVNVERANTNEGDSTYRGDNTVTTLRLQQPLWTGGRLSGNLSKAEAQAVVAEADMEMLRQQLALRVLQAWVEATSAQWKVLAYEQSRDVHARLLGLVERRTQEGNSAQADIDLASGRLDGVGADLESARAQRDTALDKLRLLVGRGVQIDELGRIADGLPPTYLKKLDAVLLAARDRSPQIAKARAQDKIAEAEIDIAKATLSPEIYLRAERQYGNFSVAGQGPQSRLFVGVSSSFGGGLSNLSGIDAAKARKDAAQEDIKTQRLAVDEQVLSDVTLARAADLRRASLERVRSSSNDVYASWERQFLAGRKQWQDLMNAAREQTQNEILLADSIATQNLSGWRLSILTQGVDGTLETRSRLLTQGLVPFNNGQADRAEPAVLPQWTKP